MKNCELQFTRIRYSIRGGFIVMSNNRAIITRSLFKTCLVVETIYVVPEEHVDLDLKGRQEKRGSCKSACKAKRCSPCFCQSFSLCHDRPNCCLYRYVRYLQIISPPFRSVLILRSSLGVVTLFLSKSVLDPLPARSTTLDERR